MTIPSAWSAAPATEFTADRAAVALDADEGMTDPPELRVEMGAPPRAKLEVDCRNAFVVLRRVAADSSAAA